MITFQNMEGDTIPLYGVKAGMVIFKTLYEHPNDLVVTLQPAPKMHEWIVFKTDEWVVLRFDSIDATVLGGHQTNLPSEVAEGIHVVHANSKDEAIQQVAINPGFYDAFQMPPVTPIEYRLVKQ